MRKEAVECSLLGKAGLHYLGWIHSFQKLYLYFYELDIIRVFASEDSFIFTSFLSFSVAVLLGADSVLDPRWEEYRCRY